MSLPAGATLKLTPFTPTFTDDQLQGLKRKLHACRGDLPPATYASKQRKYGIEHAWMEEALKYWEESFDWRKHEGRVQAVTHYRTEVEDEGQTHTIHLMAHFSEDPAAIPLILNHGWPGSAFEFLETFKILRESTSPAFHLIVPNQLGFGWSSGPPLDSPFGMEDMTRILHKLMLGLGFGSGYAAQGGDIGSVISRLMAVKYDECKAVNLNYIPPPSQFPSTDGLTDVEIKNAEKAKVFASDGRAYGVLHGTRPGTAGIIMQSSPIALLAWLSEKFKEWTDIEPSMDEILEIVTMWWLLGTYPKSLWAYSELTTGVGGWHHDPALHLSKPFGFSSFGKEISSSPKVWAAQTGDLQFYRYHEQGGHFAAMERPNAFAQDMKDCFAAIWPRSA